MKTVAVLLATLAVALAAKKVVPSNDEVFLTTFRYYPRLDHFRPQDGRIANFTYLANLEFYQPNGPIFVYINDGGIYHTEWLREGLVYDVARDTNGALITADHRFTGENLPLGSASFENLAYLTVDQALADIGILITAVKEELNNHEGPVIVWGTGYGASLATFARKKFPHLVDAVFASSAWFRPEAVDRFYYDSLSMIIRQHGSNECGELVNDAFNVLEEHIRNNATEYLQQRLRLCAPLNNQNDQEVALVVYRFIDTIAQWIKFQSFNGLQSFCRDMEAIPDDPFNSLVRWIEYAYFGGNHECVNFNYDSIIGFLSNTNWAELNQRDTLTRSLTYLSCTQIGGLKVTSDFELDVFPADLITEEYQFKFCEDVFGPQYNRSHLPGSVEAFNNLFGGQGQVISRVIFSNAGLDPFLHHGISDYDNVESRVVFVPLSSSGADLRSISGADPIELLNAKTTITEFLFRWATGAPEPPILWPMPV